jgi:hypothetical protein
LTGPWAATAYLRAASPIAVTPDARTGCLDYYHPVEDPYAHTYRYFFRPIGRYDLLWQSVAQAPSLVDPINGSQAEAIRSRLEDLRRFNPPGPGGLDLVLHRIRPIAAPTILHAGRLDRLASPTGSPPTVQPAPPGRYWQVVVGKHPEQALSEHNQTLAHRLAYRQVAWSLVRRFNPDDLIPQQALSPTLAYRVSIPYATSDSTPVAAAAHQLFLTLDGPTPVSKTIDLVDAAHDNLDGLAAAIAALGLEGVSASVVTAFPGRVYLKTSSPPGTTLRLLTDSAKPASDILVDETGIRPAKTVRSPALPGPPSIPRPFDASTLVEGSDEAIEVDLAGRLGRFGEGAMALSWKALPYYYEHQLMLVAQSTNTVSDVVELKQRAFEYVSPEPHAILDGVEGERRGRVRRVRFRLENYWSCLPSAARAAGETPSRESWPIEDPDRIVLSFTGVRPKSPAAGDSLFQRAEIDDSDLPLTLTWHGYALSKLEADALEVWRTDATLSADFRAKVGDLLEQIRLRRWRLLSSLPDPAVIFQVILARPGSVVQVLAEFFFGQDPGSPAPGYMRRNFKAKFQGIEWIVTAPTTLPEDTDPNSPRDAYLETILGPESPIPDNWISARAISSSASFTLPATLPAGMAGRLAFQAPDVLTLATYTDPDKPFTAAQIDALGKALLKSPRDTAFVAAVGRFITRLKNGETSIREPVAVGLEALQELSRTVTLPTINPGKLTWLGPISADQRTTIQRWIDHLSPFGVTLTKLLAGDTAFAIRVAYTAPGAHPKPADIPAILAPRLTIELPAVATDPEVLVWKGRDATPAQDAALKVWQDDATIDQNFQDAVKSLRDELAHPASQAIAITVDEPGWQPRPAQAELQAALAGTGAEDRIQIGVGLVEFLGLMTRDEADILLAAASSPVDKKAVAALYLDALNGGFEGAVLQIRAYRGSAAQESRPMVVALGPL